MTFDDPAAKESWQKLVEHLAQTPGVLAVLSEVMDGTLRLNYNSAQIGRETLRGLIEAQGFAVQSAEIARIGQQIAIPLNQIV